MATADRPDASAPVAVDLRVLSESGPPGGLQWAHESTDLDMTLLTWAPGQGVTPHRNDEVDVLLIGVAGAGEAIVDGVSYMLEPGRALLIPKGAERSIRCTGDILSYLSVHRRRRGLWPTVGPVGNRE
jgi:quercetin dioxygenase-like cupin family protein